MMESRMNRTITESKHVINLMDKMKGQFAENRQKPSRLETEGELKADLKEGDKFREHERGSFK